MSEPDCQAELEALIQGYIEDDLDDRECARLHEILRQRPEVASVIVAQLRQESLLRAAVQWEITLDDSREETGKRRMLAFPSAAAGEQGEEADRPQANVASIFGQRLVIWAAAAGLALLIGAALWRPNTPVEAPPARLADWDDAPLVIREGRHVRLIRDLELQPGDIIRTRKNGGSRIRFEGEETWVDLANDSELALIRVTPGKELLLLRGSVEAEVAPQLEPMICRAPWGAATVLGTRFHLMADRQSRLDVVEGKVRLETGASEAELEVATGEFVEVSADAEVTRSNLWAGNRFEAETLPLGPSTRRAPVYSHPLASGGRTRQLVVRKAGDRFVLRFPVKRPGAYLLKAGFLRGRMSGEFDLAVDGKPLGVRRDTYGAGPHPVSLVLGEVRFASDGLKDIEFQVTGRHAAGKHWRVLVDYFELVPLPGVPDEGWSGAPDSLEVEAGSALRVAAPGVLANDEPRASTEAVLAMSPRHGRLSLRRDGGLAYVPEAGFTGSDEFHYVLRREDAFSKPVSVVVNVLPESRPLEVFRSRNAPVIDGRFDPVWESAARHPVRRLIAGERGGNFQAAFRVLWDDERLYFWVEVEDATPMRDSPTRTHEDDAIEIYLDANRDKPVTYGRDDVAWRFVRGAESAEAFSGEENASDPPEFALVETGSGYRLEASFDLKALGQRERGSGAEFGLDVHVMDDRDGRARDALLAWHNTQSLAYHNLSTIGNARLSGSPRSKGGNASPEPVPDHRKR